MTLTQMTINKIIKEASDFADKCEVKNDYQIGWKNGSERGYQAGATEWAGKAQPAIDTIEQIANSPVPTNEREMASRIETARNMAETTLAKYKEVSNDKETTQGNS